MNGRERITRAVEHGWPDRLPARIGPSRLMWKTYREQLGDLVARLAEPSDFGFGNDAPETSFDAMPAVEREGGSFVDAWGVAWENAQEGIIGLPRVHPLAEWQALERLIAPSVEVDEWGELIDYAELGRQIAASGHEHYVRVDGGRTWERMWFLRGMEPLMLDLAEGRPEVQRLLDIVVEHNLARVERWLTLDIDGVMFGDDWGTQDRLLISPRHWRQYFKPAYARLFERVRRAGKHTWLHSDGHILPIIPDLIEIGLDVINPQLNANGIDEIARLCKGKICVEADLDRQYTIPFGTPVQVREHVREVVAKLGSPAGGATIIAYQYPLAPLANVEALLQAFRDYCPLPATGARTIGSVRSA